MFDFLSGLFQFVLAAQPVVVAVALAQMLYLKKLPPARLVRVSGDKARELTTTFLDGLEEGRFGFPSGMFRIDERHTTENVVVATEQVSWHSQLLDLFRSAWGFAANFGGLGMVVGGVALLVAGLYLLPALIGELGAKAFLRSRIRARISSLPDAPGSQVEFDARGPCALLLTRQLRTAFADPVLPSHIAHAAGLTDPEAA